MLYGLPSTLVSYMYTSLISSNKLTEADTDMVQLGSLYAINPLGLNPRSCVYDRYGNDVV